MMELKPCPFCGGEAKLKKGFPWQQDKKQAVALVQCTKCGCRTPVNRQCAYQARADVYEYVIKTWNRREGE